MGSSDLTWDNNMSKLILGLLLLSLVQASPDLRLRREAEDTTDVADTDLIIDNVVVVDEGLDNTEVNCHKCLKASFSFKKVNFCKKCKKQGKYNEKDAYPETCEKCNKPKFHSKHPVYCEEKCKIILNEETTTTSTTEAPDLGPLGNILKILIQANTYT